MIMIVEDEQHIQRLVQFILEKKTTHKVVACDSGEQALKFLADAKELPALILLDIMMPGIDGLQVLRALKENTKTKQIPVVMLTALAQESVVLKGIELGAKDYIRKPFHPDQLLARLSKFIENPNP